MSYEELHQNLKKIGPTFSQTGEKQAQIVQMIKRFEIKPEMKTTINMDIQGLRKKKRPFSKGPASKRLWQTWSSLERNGMLNVGLSRNWVRLVFPAIPMFFFIYCCQPFIYGNIDIMHYANYQWEGIYYKYGADRMSQCDQSITRLA